MKIIVNNNNVVNENENFIGIFGFVCHFYILIKEKKIYIYCHQTNSYHVRIHQEKKTK